MKRRTLLQHLALLAPVALFGRHLHAAEATTAIVLSTLGFVLTAPLWLAVLALGSIGLLAYLFVRERSAVPQPAH